MLSFASTVVQAGTTICQLEQVELPIFIKTIGWNNENGRAVVVNGLGDKFPAKVVLSKKGAGGGLRTNILVELPEKSDYHPLVIAEFTVFPANNTHRVIGIGYTIEDGKRYLSSSFGNLEANCQSRDD